jgi:adenine-specific DNA glycosylase
VGDYTAGAIASFAFDLPYPAVDGNVLRVAARLLGYGEDILSPKAKKELTAAVWAAQPKDDAARFNQAMIELGATVCLPNGTPKCDVCPLAGECVAHREGREGELPVRKKPNARKIQHRTVLILREGDRVALRQRPKTGLLASLFEPFCLDGALSEDEILRFLAERGIVPLRLAPLGDAKHIFTHIEWKMQGFEVILDGESAKTVLENVDSTLFFAPREEIDENYALPSAFAAYRAFM